MYWVVTLFIHYTIYNTSTLVHFVTYSQGMYCRVSQVLITNLVFYLLFKNKTKKFVVQIYGSGIKFKGRQCGLARQIRSTPPGFYSDKLAVAHTLIILECWD